MGDQHSGFSQGSRHGWRQSRAGERGGMISGIQSLSCPPAASSVGSEAPSPSSPAPNCKWPEKGAQSDAPFPSLCGVLESHWLLPVIS